MKRILRPLLLAALLFTVKANAQTTADCNADFSFAVSGFYVYFSAADNIDSVSVKHYWNFGNGNEGVGGQFTNITYSAPGTYVVTHTVKRITPNGAVICEKSASKNIVIQPVPFPCELGAGFNFKRDSIQTNKVYFTNTTAPSSALTSYKWSFGDGTYSDAANPAHVFTASGLYTVCLQVKRGDNCYDDTCSYVQVQVPGTDPCNLSISFTSLVDSFAFNKIHFSSSVIPFSSSDSIRWIFGDGQTSGDLNPVHIYPNAGTYNVCLVVKRNYNVIGTVPCVREYCKEIIVRAPCNLKADFSFVKDSLVATPLNTYRFTNTSIPTGGSDSTFWNFGDGSPLVVNVNNPIHAFTAPGTYNVCLIVKQKAINSTGTPCASYSCKTIVVGQLPPPCNITPYFSWNADSTDHKKIRFFNQTQTTITTARAVWSFGDGTSADSWNADHVYEHGRTYTVCLKIKQNDTCIREFCKTIVVDSVPVPCDLVAAFGFKRDSTQPNKVYFYNVSPIASNDIIKWSFGDGTYSYDHNPEHVFTTSGLYNVCLYVSRNNDCAADTCMLVQVQAPNPTPCTLIANFAVHADSFNTRKIYFSNLSTPVSSVDSVRWTFGDGTASTEINPVHVYNVPGVYNVCIRVQRFNAAGTAPCVKEYCQLVTVKDSCRLKADFISWKDSISGIALHTYHFKNTSESTTAATDSTFWDFGDGTPMVINQNEPVHIYTTAGTYIVCLTVKKVSNVADLIYCVKEICKTIVIINPPPPCNLQANFAWKTDSAQPKKVFFVNLSQPVNTTAIFEWSFGDGTGANSWNADHVYNHSGTYTVCLKIKQSNTCYQEICKAIKIDSLVEDDSCHLQVNFKHYISTINNRNVIFSNTTITPSSAATATWSFGDGTSATTWNAEHLYAQPGKYIVCLKVKTGPDCISYTCDTVIITGGVTNCNNLYARYEAKKDSYMPNKVYFTAVTNIPAAYQTWLITKLFSLDSTVILQQNNPAYVFTDTGYYDVCLVIPAEAGCVKVFCDQVQISSTAVPTQCVLQPYPNPANSLVNINLQLSEPEMIKISVYDLQNVLVMERSQTGVTGNNTVQLNIQSLIPGFYSIRFIYGNSVCYARFQKL